MFLLSELQNLQKENDGKLCLRMDFTAWSTVKLLALAYTIVNPFYIHYSALAPFRTTFKEWFVHASAQIG